MDQQTYGQRLICESSSTRFVAAVDGMAAALPHPDGPTIRITLTSVCDGSPLGYVDIDSTNLWDLAQAANARTTTTSAGPVRPVLRIVGGAA